MAIDGAVLGDELARIGYVGGMPCPARPPGRVRRAAHRAGPGAREPRASPSARSPACRASRGRSSPSPASRTTPAPPRSSCATTPATWPPRSPWPCAGWPTRRPGLVGTVGRIDLHPGPRQRGRGPGHAHRRPAPHRRADAGPGRGPPRDRGGRPGRRPRASRCRGAGWPASTRSTSTRRSSTWSRRSPTAHGRSVRRMPSGAGHDAQMLARVCPAGMIFTPSVGGISHNPTELHRTPTTSRPAPTSCSTSSSASRPTRPDRRRPDATR